MGSEAKKFATYEDLLKVPDHLVAEIIAGELIKSPRPGPHHARTTSALGMKIGGPFDLGTGGPGGWWIIDEPEIHLHGDILVPDLAGWKRDLFPTLPRSGSHFTTAPQWVCEVLSPSTAKIDRVRKLPVYAREKVNHVWMIHPIDRSLDVYQKNESSWTLLQSFAGDDLVRAVPFDEVEMDLGSLWLSD